MVPSASKIHWRYLSEEKRFPLVCQAETGGDGVDAAAWISAEREEILSRLQEHGAILFRGFSNIDVMQFEKIIRLLSGELLEYRERSSPRSQIEGNIYTSTDYPPHQPIYLHNENSYSHSFAKKIFFYCQTASQTGGETPIADVRKVYSHIPEVIRNRFREKGVRYVRNFSDNIGLTWKTVFQTEDREQVEQYCQSAGYSWEWKKDGGLRVARSSRASARHPHTGEPIWFNHATFFHITTFDEKLRKALQQIYSEEDLPNNTYYGDGSPIEDSTLEALRLAYAKETVKFAWQEGDILMLDNLMAAHAREPFTGARKVLVGMSEMTNWDELPEI